jgi:sugar transferase (PEP-CTERM/EpsH1 system associated)
MKILLVCHRVPYPPKRGGKIRPFNIVRHLHEQGHEVTVASLARDRAELEESAGLSRHCSRSIVEVIEDRIAWPRMVAWLPTTRPSSFGYFYSPRLERRIREVAAGGLDLIFVHCSSVAPYVVDLPAQAKIIDYGDMDSQKWREYSRHKPFPFSAGYWLEAVKLERTERLLADSFDLCTCTTRAELETLKALGVTRPSGWYPNGVDAEFFKPAPGGDYDPDLVSFIGRMDYFPNQQGVLKFCAETLPELQRRRPATRFEIVGADPPAEIRALAKLPGVTVTGSVPDVRPYVTRAALTVVPLDIARGTQNKILESLAMGVPVVCSSAATGGVDVVPGEHLLEFSTSQQLVDRILSVLESPQERRRLAEAGRARVLSNHSWPSSMKRLDALIAATMERTARRPAAAMSA